jgi:hypothetical protein
MQQHKPVLLCEPKSAADPRELMQQYDEALQPQPSGVPSRGAVFFAVCRGKVRTTFLNFKHMNFEP